MAGCDGCITKIACHQPSRPSKHWQTQLAPRNTSKLRVCRATAIALVLGGRLLSVASGGWVLGIILDICREILWRAISACTLYGAISMVPLCPDTEPRHESRANREQRTANAPCLAPSSENTGCIWPDPIRPPHIAALLAAALSSPSWQDSCSVP
jgi:hypothetical protein